jgi:hypothetical protein
MRRLYVRIYLAVLASLAALALAAGLLWRVVGDGGPVDHAFDLAGTLAHNVLPPAEAPAREQQAALERLTANLRADPVVRRLTARLGRLHAGVESLGAGNLSARVKVEGRDEVAVAIAAAVERGGPPVPCRRGVVVCCPA